VKNKEKSNEDGPPLLDDYIMQMESIVEKNLKIYKDLASDISMVKHLMQEEEMAAWEVGGNNNS
jgi:hypothetical protein